MTTPSANFTAATTNRSDSIAPDVECNRRILRRFLIAWLAGGVLLLLLIAVPDTTRTQEARVLVTAREMLERSSAGGVREWLVPHLNDKPRLQKPPLAYWLTAASLATFGVSDFSGRLPAALAMWLTIGATFAIVRRHFGVRAAAFAAAALFGSVMFVRYGALAETDVWVALFNTLAIGAMWRCFEIERNSPPPGAFALRAHVSALAIALLALVKGPPAMFPLLFLLGAAGVLRRWDVPLRWLRVGAPLTALLIAVPWFAYIARTPEAQILWNELNVVASGGGHRGTFFVYFFDLLVASAPWSGVMVLAVAAAIRRARTDARLRVTLVWFAAVFVPLCIVGQKQRHYLMPAMPPLAMLTGWLIDRAIRSSRGADDADDATDGLARAVRPVLIATLCVGLAAAVGLPIAGYFMRGRVLLISDIIIGCAIALGAAYGLWLQSRRGVAASATALAVLGFPAIAFTLLYWSPSTQAHTYRELAATLRREERERTIAPRYAFYAQPENLPLCWAMRRVIPSLPAPPDIAAALEADPKLNLITAAPRSRADDPPPPLPPGYVERLRLQIDGRPIVVYAPKS
ncbi:MAG: hypothetical protein QOF78_3176 [Phycisphaerales bacterium]|jgi:4-amino-4-deoxy-L-arabinose transferase-like glycosyltransferase|nr:hypothetical protein [Phycisphaerales bacterium]